MLSSQTKRPTPVPNYSSYFVFVLKGCADLLLAIANVFRFFLYLHSFLLFQLHLCPFCNMFLFICFIFVFVLSFFVSFFVFLYLRFLALLVVRCLPRSVFLSSFDLFVLSFCLSFLIVYLVLCRVPSCFLLFFYSCRIQPSP